MVLPYGANKKIDPASVLEGQDPGAPAKPMIKTKLWVTTAISLVVFGLFYYATESGLIDLRPPEAGG
jgi:predicted secreted protein